MTGTGPKLSNFAEKPSFSRFGDFLVVKTLFLSPKRTFWPPRTPWEKPENGHFPRPDTRICTHESTMPVKKRKRNLGKKPKYHGHTSAGPENSYPRCADPAKKAKKRHQRRFLSLGMEMMA
jgi:hypothetical protein